MHKEKENFVVDRSNSRLLLTRFPHKLCKTVRFWTTEKSSCNLLPKGVLKLDLICTRGLDTKEDEIHNT